MKKVHIVSFGYCDYAFESVTKATDAIKLFSNLKRVKFALPRPKRGTIRCICGFSDVAPRQSCTHCGRPFSESHNRTHQSTAIPSHSTLRLVE